VPRLNLSDSLTIGPINTKKLMADIEPICTVNCDVNFNGVVFSNKFEETHRNPPYQQNSGLSHLRLTRRTENSKGTANLKDTTRRLFGVLRTAWHWNLAVDTKLGFRMSSLQLKIGSNC